MSEKAKHFRYFNLDHSVQLMKSPIDITDNAIQTIKKLIQDIKDIGSSSWCDKRM